MLQVIAKPTFSNDLTYMGKGDLLPKEIVHLILYSNAIDTSVFCKALRDALGPCLIEAAVARDLVFASAAFYARYAYDQINDLAFGKEPAFRYC